MTTWTPKGSDIYKAFWYHQMKIATIHKVVFMSYDQKHWNSEKTYPLYFKEGNSDAAWTVGLYVSVEEAGMSRLPHVNTVYEAALGKEKLWENLLVFHRNFRLYHIIHNINPIVSSQYVSPLSPCQENIVYYKLGIYRELTAFRYTFNYMIQFQFPAL